MNRMDTHAAYVNRLALHARPDAQPEHNYLVVRPEEIRPVDPTDVSFANNLPGHIIQLDCQGFYYRVEIQVLDTVFLAYWTRHAVEEKGIETGKAMHIAFPASAVHTFAEPQPERA